MSSLELGKTLGPSSGLSETELGTGLSLLQEEGGVMIGGAQVGPENELVWISNSFLHQFIQRAEGRIFTDSHDHAASASGGKWLEVGRSPERISIVLGGEDAVMEAENGMPVRFRFASRAASNRSSGPQTRS